MEQFPKVLGLGEQNYPDCCCCIVRASLGRDHREGTDCARVIPGEWRSHPGLTLNLHKLQDGLQHIFSNGVKYFNCFSPRAWRVDLTRKLSLNQLSLNQMSDLSLV